MALYLSKSRLFFHSGSFGAVSSSPDSMPYWKFSFVLSYHISLYQKNAASEKNSPQCGIESGVEETAPKGKNYSVMGVK